MHAQRRGARRRLWTALVALAVVCGCEGESKQSSLPERPAQAPGVEGMQWLKEHGYVDEKGRPIPEDQRK